MRRGRWLGIGLGVLAVGLGLAGCAGTGRGAAQAEAHIVGAGEAPTGFLRVEGVPDLEFPAAHGPHPDYQTEWWYYTGNLSTADGQRFGYQLTFFRRALEPEAVRAARTSDWATEQIYMGHLALTDVAGNQHLAFERFSRGAAGLAGAEANPYQVWLEDWQVVAAGEGAYQMSAEAEGVALDLLLTDHKGPALQGDQGYSQKGPEAGDASVYYSLTRLESAGTVRVDGREYAVSGLSWMDHEYSTSALGTGQVGWDWFSLQLDDDTELMLYQIRRADGSVDPWSKGSIIGTEAQVEALRWEDGDYRIEVLGTWHSPETGADYPAGWRIEVPSLDLEVTIEPLVADQELNVSYAYWEGAVSIQGTHAGQPVGGMGYVELTGYAASMEGQF